MKVISLMERMGCFVSRSWDCGKSFVLLLNDGIDAFSKNNHILQQRFQIFHKRATLFYRTRITIALAMEPFSVLRTHMYTPVGTRLPR